MLTLVFKVLVPAGDKGQMVAWRGHNEGTAAMFLGRGPHAFTSGAAHQLYIDARINLVGGDPFHLNLEAARDTDIA
jgi:hypothetical protein